MTNPKATWFLLPRAFFALVIAAAAGAAPVALAEIKIAVIDPARAIGASEEAKSLFAKASEEFKPDEESLLKLRDDIQALNERREKDAEVMGAAEVAKLNKEIENKTIDFRFEQQKMQKAAQDKEQEIIAELAPKYRKVLEDIIALEQIDVVLSPQGLQYFNPKHDFTRRVTEKLNEMNSRKGKK